MRFAGLARFLSTKRSFKYRLIVSFCILSIVPVIATQVISFYNVAWKLQVKIDALENTNLAQTRKIIRTNLDFYEDLLSQMYTDDHLIDLVKKLSAGENVEFNSGQLRRALHAYAYTMPYVESITVLMSDGRIVFDDLLTGYNTMTSWLDIDGGRPAELFRSVISANETRLFPSQPASFYTAKKYYLFHLGHRLVDYKDIRRKNGVIILSIDEKMLGDICDERLDGSTSGTTEDSMFIIAGDGTIVSFPNKSYVGRKIELHDDPAVRRDDITRMIWGAGSTGASKKSIYELREPKSGWSVFAARDQGIMYREITAQQRVSILVILLSVVVLFAIIFYTTGRLTRSIGTVVAAMNAAAAGELSARIETDRAMPLEIEEIAEKFNAMIEKIRALVHELQTASTKQRNAEISALEAQVNPHFLYNTLDTINWMAIERDELEISEAIAALAEILRYGIDNSNEVVAIRQEVEWLRHYVSLQRIRLKDSFDFALDVDPSTLDCPARKLLFQPFVENSIVHGFRGVEKRPELRVSIGREGSRLRVTISDNGRGIDAETLGLIEAGGLPDSGARGHTGIRNAIARIEAYYGSAATVAVESVLGAGTRIRIEYPV